MHSGKLNLLGLVGLQAKIKFRLYKHQVNRCIRFIYSLLYVDVVTLGCRSLFSKGEIDKLWLGFCVLGKENQ